MNTLSVKKA